MLSWALTGVWELDRHMGKSSVLGRIMKAGLVLKSTWCGEGGMVGWEVVGEGGGPGFQSLQSSWAERAFSFRNHCLDVVAVVSVAAEDQLRGWSHEMMALWTRVEVVSFRKVGCMESIACVC
jgi:hypothetical protein